MRRTIQHRHESCSTRRQMQSHALHQRVSRLLLLHGDERRAHRLLLAEPGGGALHHQHPQTLLLQLQPGARGVHRPAGRHAHPPHPHPRLPHAGHGGAGGLVQQTERHPGLASAGPSPSGARRALIDLDGKNTFRRTEASHLISPKRRTFRASGPPVFQPELLFLVSLRSLMPNCRC